MATVPISLCMAMHPRVGADSPLRVLSADILESIYVALVPVAIPDHCPTLLDALDKYRHRRVLHILLRNIEHSVGQRACDDLANWRHTLERPGTHPLRLHIVGEPGAVLRVSSERSIPVSFPLNPSAF